MSRAGHSEETYKERGKNSRRAGIGRILNRIGVILMALVCLVCLALVLPGAAGFEAYVVVSGSMEPEIPVGSIVYSKSTEASELNPGDVIVFTDPSRGTTPITHRVVENYAAESRIITKGDANARNDVNPVEYRNVKGIVQAHIPYLGFAASLLASPAGKLFAALLLAEAWLLTEIGRRLMPGR